MRNGHMVRGARGAIALLLAAGLLAAGATSVAAGGRGATVVRGIQQAYGTCGANSDGYAMTGSLERLLVGPDVRREAAARDGDHARQRRRALRRLPRRRLRHLRDRVHLHRQVRRGDGAPRPLPPPDHRGLRRVPWCAWRDELHRRGRQRAVLLPVLGQHPARPHGAATAASTTARERGQRRRDRDPPSGSSPARPRPADAIPAYFRRYAAGVMPVARRNRRRKNVGSSYPT